MLDPISAMQVAAEVLVHDGGSGPAKCPFRPMEFNIVVELDPVEEKTKGGIILIPEKQERDKLGAEEGVLVAISPLAFSYANPSEWGDHEKPKIGDRVMVKRYDGVLREKDGKSYRIVPDKSLVAVIEGDE
jgi:co-chaperonin GroES (HSP10)